MAPPPRPLALAHPATPSGHSATVAGHGSTIAHQAATVAGHVSTGAQSVSASSLLVQMVVGLAVIIVLIKLASRLVRGRDGRALGHGPRPHGVSVVGRQSLGKGVQVAMVTAGSQTYLLGVTQRQITLLGEIDATEPVAVSVGSHDPVAAGLQLVSGGSGGAALTSGTATATTAMAGTTTATNTPAWRSAIEQMRVRTVRRA